MSTKQQASTHIGKAFHFLLILAFLVILLPSGTIVYARQSAASPALLADSGDGFKVYLPLIRNGGTNTDLPLMSGFSPNGWPDANTINTEMKPLDNWITGVTGGKATSIFGTFLPLSLTDSTATQNVEVPLTVIWEAGYTPFVNLSAAGGDTAQEVATSADYDRWIRTWAKSFLAYANNGTRFAYIAPLQEMNGYWVNYGGDPTNFILAYKRFQTIFAEVGVPRESVKWVFAPNGWTRHDMPMFEAYYPGDAYVDVVAISAYDYGDCHPGGWTDPENVYNDPGFENGHYLDRLRTLAPSKPIFIAQTATAGEIDSLNKEAWLKEAYKYLSEQQNVRAVIYFNFSGDCKWPVFKNGVGNPGYKAGVNSNGYKYISPAALMKTDHTIR